MAGAIDELQLQSALGVQRRWGRALGATMVEMGILKEETLVKVLSQQLNVPLVDIRSIAVSSDALRLLDAEFCLEAGCIPFRYQERGTFLDLAMADPTNPELYDRIRVRTRCNIRPHLAGPRSIEAAIRHYYLGEELNDPSRPSTENHPWVGRPDEVMFEMDSRLGADRQRPQPPPATFAPPGPQSAPPMDAAGRDALLTQLHQLVRQMRAHIERDEKVLKKLMRLLVEKGVCTREELIAKLHEE
jgi:type IV pilus assembly protein PilB